MRGPIICRQIQIAVGYNDAPIYAEDGITITTPAGLQMENQCIGYDCNLFQFIPIINAQLYYVFAQPDAYRTQAVEQLVFTNVHNGILSCYPWLLDYMSLPSLEMLKNTAPIHRKQVVAAINKLKSSKDMKEQTHFEKINVISGYHEEPIYAEDNVTVIEPAGLQISVREKGLDIPAYKVDFITSVNSELERIFTDENIDIRQQMLDAMMMAYADSDIVEYYPWLLDYTSLPALIFLKSAMPLYTEQITEAITKLEKGNQKVNKTN